MTLINPFNIGGKGPYKGPSLCPNCFQRYHMCECHAIATREYKDVIGNVITHEGDILKNEPKGFERLRRHFFVPPLLGPEYQQAAARWVCPRCNRPLPRNVEMFTGRIIAVVATRGVGKTNYITALIKALNSPDFVDAAGGKARCQAISPDISERYFDNFHNPLFDEKKVFDANQVAGVSGARPDPLIYRITVGRGRFRTRSINLLFYDGSGEDMARAEYRNDYCQYIANASALIYLVDPLKTGIYQQLPGHVQGMRASSSVNIPEEEIMKSVVDSVTERLGQAPESSLKIPTVITLAKSDLLSCVEGVGDTSFAKESDYKNGFNPSDADVVSSEVEELLRRHAKEVWEITRSLFKNVKYAAVSSTGCSPDSNTPPRYPFIKPHRCLDPLLRLLYELKIIRVK